MESIGGKLIAARETKGVSLEQAARDTHISKRYIAALESEDFDDFPGEAYFLGFLRSYASYLGLDSNDVVTLYRNIQLQEQPAPINELLDRKPRRKLPLIPLLLVVLVLVVGGIVTLFATGRLRLLSFQQSAAEDAEQAVALRLSDQFVEQRFNEGNRVAVPLGELEAIFEFVSIGERVAIGSEAGIVELSGGDERLLDITGGGSPDIRVAIRRIYPDEVPPAAVARIDRVLQPATVAGEPETTVLSEEDRAGIAIGHTLEQSRERNPRVVVRPEQNAPFQVQAEFLGLTVFRYQVDGLDRQEQVLSDGESLTFTADELARLWVSNAGNVRMNVAGAALDLGSQGEVVSLVLRRTVSNGSLAIEQLPLY